MELDKLPTQLVLPWCLNINSDDYDTECGQGTSFLSLFFALLVYMPITLTYSWLDFLTYIFSQNAK
ncbi:hypothetical protein KSZ_30740 [Dictyobacter formicarum]|uniref:Uncharacterized protein n=1 Tax=Dictyobacter formicarum TaxID=2778368 RepID=A0ABQ3VI72_9CHLR|nr:hypothetical protein KSZ_30740 [Dictyobacter formicarum]